uniref:DDE_Tnp_1_7 domain-containing protein n=1 Tax=Panagrellus redivivus TaxID=6233 RepID=A0A7E4VXL0_PANRE
VHTSHSDVFAPYANPFNDSCFNSPQGPNPVNGHSHQHGSDTRLPHDNNSVSSSGSVSSQVIAHEQTQVDPSRNTLPPARPKVRSKLPKISLIKFDGHREKYPEFIQTFNERIGNDPELATIDKMYYLLMYL